jgi:hypothetical protein
MDAFELPALDQRRADAGQLYHEFLRVPDLSAGLYVLEAGAVDPQGPHTEDELYVVMAGRARITVGDDVCAVTSGSVVFRRCRRPASIPRHRRAARTHRRLRSGRALPGLSDRQVARSATTRSNSSASSAPRPTSSWRKKTYTSSPAERNGSIRSAHAARDRAS